jgi:UDP-N-acetylglucosamine diphosphorylase/glucosamine-1-phosphate N-acetyltransferase
MSLNYILFDSQYRTDLLPLTYTRPVAAIRIGILTIAEKWMQHLNADVSYLTQPYLQQRFPLNISSDNVLINGSVLPTDTCAAAIHQLQPNEALMSGQELIAIRLNEEAVHTFDASKAWEGKTVSLPTVPIVLKKVYDIFTKNADALQYDFKKITAGRISEKLPAGTQAVNPENIFIEPGAKIDFAILNASTGPIYIGKNTEVMEGCKIRGPFALCEGAGLKMDAKIYGPTTLGPYCKAGGELNNVVMFGYSNKGHDGFLGNAVIGEWCNLGADTNNSNLKNTYEEVKLWNYRTEKFEKTGLTFCGLIMGDHSKCGINTMFNTGTVVGTGANIFGAGFPRNFIPSFAWGGAQGFETFQLAKFYKTAEAMCARRNIHFDETDRAILHHVYEESKRFRYWEKEN